MRCFGSEIRPLRKPVVVYSRNVMWTPLVESTVYPSFFVGPDTYLHLDHSHLRSSFALVMLRVASAPGNLLPGWCYYSRRPIGTHGRVRAHPQPCRWLYDIAIADHLQVGQSARCGMLVVWLTERVHSKFRNLARYSRVSTARHVVVPIDVPWPPLFSSIVAVDCVVPPG